MTQRTLAGDPAPCRCWSGSGVAAAWCRCPTSPTSPGSTVDVLGARPTARRSSRSTGHKTYRDDGAAPDDHGLRHPAARPTINLFEAMQAWLSDERRGLPVRRGLPRRTRPRGGPQARAPCEMVSSQDAAIAAALTELGYDVDAGHRGAERRRRTCRPTACSRSRDVILEVDGETVDTPDDVVEAVTRPPAGKPLDVRRTPRRQGRATGRA